MKPALAQVCSLSAPFAQQIADYAAGQCQAIELWLTKLEDYVQKHSLDAVRHLLAEHGMAAPVASYQGGLFGPADAVRQASWDLFEARLQLCRSLGVNTLVVAADRFGPAQQAELAPLLELLKQAAQRAEQHGLRLALEFQGRAGLVNNLQTAAVLVHEVRSPALGICLDAFHFAVGPSKLEDLGHLQADNLFHVQLCDLADTLRELATDSERILPGDGDLPLQPIVERLQRIGYEGHVAIELMNPQMWRISSLTFGEIALTALRRVLGQASIE
jgi:2-keto-myo-inositol isomerase